MTSPQVLGGRCEERGLGVGRGGEGGMWEGRNKRRDGGRGEGQGLRRRSLAVDNQGRVCTLGCITRRVWQGDV